MSNITSKVYCTVIADHLLEVHFNKNNFNSGIVLRNDTEYNSTEFGLSISGIYNPG